MKLLMSLTFVTKVLCFTSIRCLSKYARIGMALHLSLRLHTIFTDKTKNWPLVSTLEGCNVGWQFCQFKWLNVPHLLAKGLVVFVFPSLQFRLQLLNKISTQHLDSTCTCSRRPFWIINTVERFTTLTLTLKHTSGENRFIEQKRWKKWLRLQSVEFVVLHALVGNPM